LRKLVPWLRRRRAGWSGESDRAFHDTLFASHDHDAFSPAYTGNITIRRFADLAAPEVEDCEFVVDVGCGLGEITCELARRYPRVRFLGVDHSRAGIAGAQRNRERLGLSNVAFEIHDMERFDPGEDVDLVAMFDAFHHLLDPQAFIDRMGKRTRRFLLIEPQGDWKGSWIRDLDLDWLARDLEKIRARLAHAVGERPSPPAVDEEAAPRRRQGSADRPATSPPATRGAPAHRDAAARRTAPAAATDDGEPVENRYSIETFEKMFAGYGLRIRGTISGLDEYPPEPTLDTPTRREFGELAYRLYRSADERLFETGLDLHAKHLVICAEAGAEPVRRAPALPLPGGRPEGDLRGAHDVEYLSYQGPTQAPPAASFTATVRLRNRSFRAWSSAAAEQPDFISYHWLDDQGLTVVEDGRRSPLPRGLEPGEELDAAVRIDAPSEPGSYILAIDLVQENKTWFRDAGSPPLEVPLRIKR
jgi:SAM-dependent methyltransferase